MRAVGIDLGQKRIGVALSDSDGLIALPYDTLLRSGDPEVDHRRIRELVEECEAEIVVVGMPTSLDGSVGPAARRTLKELRRLRERLEVPVETYDERFTTVSAHNLLREAEVGGRRRREVVDATAAAVMLQAWLDGQRGRPQAHVDRTEDD